MSAAATFMGFPFHKVASLMRLLSDFQIVATSSRQFGKPDRLRQWVIPSFQILSTLSTKLNWVVFLQPPTQRVVVSVESDDE